MANKENFLTSEIIALGLKGYKIGRKIGQGSYAEVHLADYAEGQKKVKLACKICDKERAPKDFIDKFFPREVDILTKIENTHIIQIHSILQRGPKVYIFMRYADNGDLLEFIKQNGLLPEKQAKIWLWQIASGLHYLHSHHIAHRDLKCENILLSRHWNAKLTDFGFARYCVDENGEVLMSNTYCGSAAYAAPEVVEGIPYNPKIADLWSLGIVLFIMVNASMPFDDTNLQKLLQDQQNREWTFRTRVKDMLSTSIKNIITGLLEPEPEYRMTLDAVLSHELLSDGTCNNKLRKASIIFKKFISPLL